MSAEKIKDSIQKTKEQIEKLKQDCQKQIEILFSQEAKSLFNNHCHLDNFSWEQYTCYFNDGDECYFKSYTDDQFCVNGHRFYDIEYYENLYYLKDVAEKIRNFLSKFDDDDMKEMFGDHVKVIVNREGVSVETYTDHD